MANFSFPMEKILQVKKKLEKQKQLELGQAMEKLEKEKKQTTYLEEQLIAANQYFQEGISGGHMDAAIIKRRHERIRFYHQALQEQAIITNNCEEGVQQAKENLKNALQERKIFESLKEKALEAYYEEEKLDEANRIDEIVSYKYGVKMTEK